MLRNYLTIALRQLRSQRAYTLLNVTGLTVGMAGGLLIFLFIRHHWQTDRHHVKSDRTYRIVLDLHLEDGSVEYYPEAPLPMAAEMRRALPQVEQAASLLGRRSMTINLNRPDLSRRNLSRPDLSRPDASGQTTAMQFLEPEGTTALVEPELFQILDYTWLSGNPKTALRAPGSVVLTQSWAKRYFGDANPMGQRLEIDHRATATVTGVVADPVQPTDTQVNLFVSMGTIRQLNPEYDVNNWDQMSSTDRLYVTLRDASDATAQQVEAALPTLAKKHIGPMAHFHVQPLTDAHFDVQRAGGIIRPSLLWSVGLIGVFLVVIACINFVNLATAQAFRRSKEVGVRKTMGSSRRQLAGQFLLETSLIVGVATVLAVLVSVLVLPTFSDWVQLRLSLRPDGSMLLSMAGLLILVVALAGGYPAFVLSGFRPDSALRKTAILSASAGGLSLRKGLVVLQFVVCQALLVGALVVMHQIRFIQQTDLGFRPDNVLIVKLPAEEKQSWQAFKTELRQYPDIRSVSLQYRPPSAAVMNGGSFKFGSATDWEKFPVRERLADADYLPTYDLKLIAGRNIAESNSIREYVITENLARKLGFRNPANILGKRLQYYLSPVALPIVGVVKDFHLKSLHEAISPCLITSYPRMYQQIGIRMAGQSATKTLAHIRSVWQRLYPNDVFSYEFLNDQLSQFYATETTISRLVNVFTFVAVLICALGLFGLVSFTVGQRTKEIGIRKVLGASVAGIVVLLSKDFLWLVFVAILIASPIAWYAMHSWLADFAYRIDMTWWMFTGAGLLAVGIALLTVSFQSIRAALANPVKALRAE